MKYPVPFSIILPLNDSNTTRIENIFQNILHQTFQEFELIVVDFGSTDNLESSVAQFKDSRIRYFKERKHKKYYYSMNLGIKNAKGKYLAFMSPNIIPNLKRLEIQYLYFESHPHVGGISGLVNTQDSRWPPPTTIEWPLNYSEIQVALLKDNYLNISTISIRKHLILKNKLNYVEMSQYATDYDFALKLSKSLIVKNLPFIFGVEDVNNNRYLFDDYLVLRRTKDKVRKSQLNCFGLKFTQKELDIHLRLMEEVFLTDTELNASKKWSKKLIRANDEKKIYNGFHLKKFLKLLIQKAHDINALGGWSIEKDMILFINKLLPEGSSILEFGSGKGTEALLLNYNVTSVEHNEYYNYRRSTNHKTILAHVERGWYKTSLISKVLRKKFDLIIVDGPPNELRKGLLDNLFLFEGLSIPVIFDDVDRQLDRNIMESFCAAQKYEWKTVSGTTKKFAFCTKLK